MDSQSISFKIQWVVTDSLRLERQRSAKTLFLANTGIGRNWLAYITPARSLFSLRLYLHYAQLLRRETGIGASIADVFPRAWTQKIQSRFRESGFEYHRMILSQILSLRMELFNSRTNNSDSFLQIIRREIQCRTEPNGVVATAENHQALMEAFLQELLA